MRLIWQAEDIKGGIVVGRPGRLEEWMIAYVAPMVGPNLYQLVSYNGDGLLCCAPLSAEEMANRLNENGEWPIELLEASEDASIDASVEAEIAAQE